MKIVIALGGNALLRRGEPTGADEQRASARVAAAAIAEIAKEHQVIIAHGNGPQVGLLDLQNLNYKDKVKPYPLDILGAETQGMIGYIIKQELQHNLPKTKIVTLLTRVVVDKSDKAFAKPSKPIGPVYHSREEIQELAKACNWTVAPDGKYFRRVVPSPLPSKIVELAAIKLLSDKNFMIICAGGGGIPVIEDNAAYVGVEAVIDKDRAAALLATELKADALIIMTDVDGVYSGWGTPNSKRLEKLTVAEAEKLDLATGSMGPKVEAICGFVKKTGNFGTICNLENGLAAVNKLAGTVIEG